MDPEYEEFMNDMDVEEFMKQTIREHDEKVFFIRQNLGAEIHWFFTQGYQALNNKLYLPACASFIIGIEASLRVVLNKLESPERIRELYSDKTLSNQLLISCKEKGMPINLLAFKNEYNFDANLKSKKPNIQDVEIVRVRHSLCHGNILEYINSELGEENKFFTPECCRELAISLYNISKSWAQGIGSL